MKLQVILASALMLAAGACAGPKLIGRPELSIVEGSKLPPPDVIDLIAKERPYVIGPLDHLTIDVYGVSDLSRAVQVDASGRIALPLVGVLKASGETPGNLAKMIAAQLRGRYVRDPQVTVNLTDTLSQVVTVDGAVSAPGVYPVAGRATLMQTIARAQGVTEFAREDYVVVFRRVNNQQLAALYDLRAIRSGIYEDPEVYANDVVLVGDSPARRFFKNALQASGVLVAPLIAILQ